MHLPFSLHGDDQVNIDVPFFFQDQACSVGIFPGGRGVEPVMLLLLGWMEQATLTPATWQRFHHLTSHCFGACR